MDIFNNQPEWAYWVTWAGMVRNLSVKQHQELVNNTRMLSKEDPAYWEVMAPFRKACGLPLLPLKSKYTVDFSGKWVFNEAKSELGNSGSANVPYEMEIDQDDDLLIVKKFMIGEYGDDSITNDEILLDGTEMRAIMSDSPRISKANLEEGSKTIKISSTLKFNRGGTTAEIKSSEKWSLKEEGNILKIVQVSTGSGGGENTVSLVFDKK